MRERLWAFNFKLRAAQAAVDDLIKPRVREPAPGNTWRPFVTLDGREAIWSPLGLDGGYLYASKLPAAALPSQVHQDSLSTRPNATRVE